jgi:hypothetical protein
MTLKGLRRIGPAHALAIVRDTNARKAPVLDLDGNGLALRIQTVFDELFDNGGRTFDHFAGGNPAHHVSRQNANFSA